MSSYDAIVIPGGGVLDGGRLPRWVQCRFERALAIQPAGPFLALSGGTPHKPNPLDDTGRPVFEAHAGARYLLEHGVPQASIFTEISSYDTIGNAFFARVQHAELRGWRRLLIVNSEFHMRRTEAIFRWVFGLEPARGYELAFETTPDEGMEAGRRRARCAREAASLAALADVISRVSTLAGLHDFLYREHQAYASEVVARPQKTDPDLGWMY